MRRLPLLLFAGALLLGLPTVAAATSVSLVPGGHGSKTFAGWRPNQGEADGYGRGRDALLFQKGLSASTYAAAVATVKGFRGRPLKRFTTGSTVLAWDRRDDGHCGLGAPRWNLVVEGQSGARYVVHLACAYATHTAGAEPGWTKDEFAGAQIRAEVLAQAGSDALAGTIRALLIVFDEATDSPGVAGTPGAVFLDDITVGPRVWRSRYS